MATNSRLTPLGIERAKAKDAEFWLSDDEGTRGGGRLVVRISPSGSKLFYFRYSVEGKRYQLPMRPYTSTPAEGRLTLQEARKEARRYSELHRLPESTDVAAYLKRLDDEAATARELAVERKAEVVRAASEESRYSLRALGDWYAKYLKAAGKQSAPGVASILKCHVNDTAWADKPARLLTAQDAAQLLRRIVEAGKGRTAGKVRSILHSAYALAIKAELDPSAPADLIPFRIPNNPIAGTAALSQFNQPRDRVLAPSEMAELWRRVWSDDDASLQIRALRLTVLLGGQRAVQLLRVKLDKVSLESETITLHDPKGRRSTPRIHLLPLQGKSKSEVASLMERATALESPRLFESRNSHLGSDVLSDLVRDISADMVRDKISPQPFQFRDLRRTAETMLAAMGISKDLRAQVQSHGLGGVQNRHYDRHDYMAEKRLALKAWEEHLDLLASNKRRAPNVRALHQT